MYIVKCHCLTMNVPRALKAYERQWDPINSAVSPNCSVSWFPLAGLQHLCLSCPPTPSTPPLSCLNNPPLISDSPLFHMCWKQLWTLSSLSPVHLVAALQEKAVLWAGPPSGGAQSLSLLLMPLCALIPRRVRQWRNWPSAQLHAIFCRLYCEVELFVLRVLSGFFNEYNYFIIWL